MCTGSKSTAASSEKRVVPSGRLVMVGMGRGDVMAAGCTALVLHRDPARGCRARSLPAPGSGVPVNFQRVIPPQLGYSRGIPAAQSALPGSEPNVRPGAPVRCQARRPRCHPRANEPPGSAEGASGTVGQDRQRRFVAPVPAHPQTSDGASSPGAPSHRHARPPLPRNLRGLADHIASIPHLLVPGPGTGGPLRSARCVPRCRGARGRIPCPTAAMCVAIPRQTPYDMAAGTSTSGMRPTSCHTRAWSSPLCVPVVHRC